MLKSLTIKNFKSFKDTTLELSPFTLMTGANASGKSNALEMFQLLKWFLNPGAHDNDNYITRLHCRGTKNTLWASDDHNIECTCRFETIASQEKFKFTIVKNDNETLVRNGEYQKGNRIVDQTEDFSISKFTTSFNSLLSANAQFSFACLDTEIKKLIEEHLDQFADLENYKDVVIGKLRSSWILDTNPFVMRTYSDKIESKFIGIHGEYLSSVVFSLCQNEDNKKILLDCIQSLPEQNITDIAFIEVKERNEVMLKLEETFGKHKRFYDASLLSDGTLRVLAIVAFLLSAPEGSIAIIEEIDNGIHPSRIKDFMGKMRALAEKRNIQVLMTSHNSALLDAIPNNKLEDVVCCYRVKEEGDSRFVRLGDLYLYPELVAQGSLGVLVTQGIVDRYVHDTRTPEDIVSQRVAWLEEFYKEQEASDA